MFVRVTEGTRAGEGWVLTTTGNIVLGTTPLTFSVFDGVGIAQQVTTNTAAIATKADQSTVAALTTTVGTKADASALTTLQGTVSANTSAIATKADAATTTSALAAKADRYQAPINYAGTALVLDGTHVEGYIRTTSASANTLTIPLNFAAMPIGSDISGIQAGDGAHAVPQGRRQHVSQVQLPLYTRTEGSPWTLYKRPRMRRPLWGSTHLMDTQHGPSGAALSHANRALYGIRGLSTTNRYDTAAPGRRRGHGCRLGVVESCRSTTCVRGSSRNRTNSSLAVWAGLLPDGGQC